MAKVYVRRKGVKIVAVSSLRDGKGQGLTEILDENHPDVQSFINPREPKEIDVLAYRYTEDIALKKLCKALAKRFGVSEQEMLNEIINA